MPGGERRARLEGVEAREVEAVEAWWRKGKGCSELRSVVRIRVDGWMLRARIGVWREGGVYAF